MSLLTSVLADLLKALPDLRPHTYFKSSLTALSHAMEDLILAGSDRPLAIASFQHERFYRQEAHRYLRIAAKTDQVYVLAAPESDFKNCSDIYETIAFNPEHPLAQEWHLVVIGQQYASCLICRERGEQMPEKKSDLAGFSLIQDRSSDLIDFSRLNLRPTVDIDPARRFEGIWTFDRQVSCQAAELLLNQILHYRPELATKIAQAKKQFLGNGASKPMVAVKGKRSKSLLVEATPAFSPNPDPFAQRLVTYLQVGQYKLLKAYRSIAAQEQRERLVNTITTAIRRSLNPEEILPVAVRELGQALGVCRCLIYRAQATDKTAEIVHEFLGPGVSSLVGQTWPLEGNYLFQEAVARREPVSISNVQADPHISALTALQTLARLWQIGSWLMMPVLHQGRLLGIVELHHCRANPRQWMKDELALVDAIATQIGVALIQSEAYANLEDLNQQLEALDRTRSNLVAITGHELRTPLSTIQVCLESLASEPDMDQELRQVMLNTALTDAERMRKLVQDFLTLSQLESGRVKWHPEALEFSECVDLALSGLRSRQHILGSVAEITTQIPDNLPLVQADGEWLVEVLSKLLDNAYKFTPPNGQIIIQARCHGSQMLLVTVADTGRGIEPQRLEVVFDRFYQEEGALQRTAGGTGLGLAICRQIVHGWGGQIWAESVGKDQGSQFHFTVPIAPNRLASC